MENSIAEMPVLKKPVRLKKPAPAKPKTKPKKTPIHQLAKKKFFDASGITQRLIDCFGNIDDAFSMVIFGDSGNGKTTGAGMLIDDCIASFNCKVAYISYEEGAGKSMQQVLVHDLKLNEKYGNCLDLYEHMNFEQLDYYMGRRKSPKIWVLDSIQASALTKEQIQYLMKKYTTGKGKKILIMISWVEGKLPQGAEAKAARYMAMVKVRVEGFIGFIKGRFRGKQNFIIWEKGAKDYWGKQFNKMVTRVK